MGEVGRKTFSANDQGNLTGSFYFSDLSTFSKTYCYGNSPRFPIFKKHLVFSNVFQRKGKTNIFNFLYKAADTREYDLIHPDILVIRSYLRFLIFM